MRKVNVVEIINWANSKGYKFDYYGDRAIQVCGFSSLSNYNDESLTWINLKNPVEESVLSRICCAVIQKGVKDLPKNYFLVEESKFFFFDIIECFFSSSNSCIMERGNSYIGKDVELGKNVIIGCNCVLDGDITIGDNTVIEHNVTVINRASIGGDCIIHSGTVIGKDGFGFSFDKNGIPQKVPHFGGIRIGNRVEIGANCVVDRGTIDDTIIGDDVKLDSLVIIAHNVVIGNGTLIVGGTTIGGSCIIGEKSYIAPHATIKNKTTVGQNTFIGMGVITTENIGDGTFIGHPTDKPRKIKNYRRFL